MGLSQRWGGKKTDGATSESDESVGGAIRKRLGMKKGGARIPEMGERGSSQHYQEEPHAMGVALGRHLQELHGGEFLHSFCGGLNASRSGQYEGGAWYDVFDPQKNGVAQAFQPLTNEFTNPDSVLRKEIVPKVVNEFKDPNSVLRGKVLPGAAAGLTSAAAALPAFAPALLPLAAAADTAQAINMGAKQMGLGRRRRGGEISDADMDRAVEQVVDMRIKGANQRTVDDFITQHYPQANKKQKDGIKLAAHRHLAKMMPAAVTLAKMPSSAKGRKGGKNYFKSAVDSIVSKVASNPMGAVNTLAGVADLGMKAYKAKGKRAPAGPNDGRRKRADIVKKVMKEKGMSMIDASKYVKQHGLY